MSGIKVVLSQLTVSELLKGIDDRIAELTKEIEAVYPELGKAAARSRSNLDAWTVRGQIAEIEKRENETARLEQLKSDIEAELRRKEHTGPGCAQD